MNEPTTRNVVRFSGHVQGVGFRATVLAEARGLAVHGFVRNEADGSVLLDAEGPRHDLDELVRRVKSAMSGFVSETTVDELPTLSRCDGLRIRY